MVRCGFDASAVTIGTKKMQTSLNGMQASVGKSTGSMISSFGKMAAAAAAAFAVRALVNFGREAIGLASDLQEVQNVVDVSFGDMAYKIEDFAKRSVDAFGMSELTAKRTSSTYMAMAKSMNIAADSASDMAIQITGRTADMASFYNVRQDVADTALKSIFTGETESLKKFGVVMTEINMQEFARLKGMNKSISAMTQSEKTMLRYQYVMEKTSLAAGDFARTSDSWANQTRVLSERWKEFQAIMGQGLIQALTPVLKLLNTIMTGLINFAKAFSAITSLIFGKQIAVASSGEQAAESEADLADGITAAGKAAKNALAGFDDLNVLQQSMGASSDIGVPTIGVEVGDVSEQPKTEWVDELSDKFKRLFESEPFTKIKNALVKSWEIIEPVVTRFKELMSTIWEDIKTALEPFVTWFKNDFLENLPGWIATASEISATALDAMVEAFQTLWGVVAGVTIPIIQLFSSVWSDVATSIGEVWESHGKPAMNSVRDAFSAVSDLVKTVWNSTLKPIFDEMNDVIDDLWTNNLKPLVDRIMKFIAILVKATADLYTKVIQPIATFLAVELAPNISLAFTTVAGIVGTAFGFITGIAGGLIRTLGGVIQFLNGVFTGDWEEAWEGIKNVVGGVWDGITTIIESAVNLIITLINGLTGMINNTFGTSIGKIPELNLPEFSSGTSGKTENIGGGGGSSWGAPAAPDIIAGANGMVIPPNDEFLYMYGDQKSGTNLEAPESLIRQIVREESSGGITFSGPDDIMQLVRILKPKFDKETTRRGGSLVVGV